MEESIICRDIHKVYCSEGEEFEALKGIDLTVCKGEFVSIMGASGSGKSTLMNILGCLDVLTKGKYVLDGHDVGELAGDELADIRNKKLGFVFQSFNLLRKTTALENVELPFLYRKYHEAEHHLTAKQIRDLAKTALDRVGLSNRMNHMPSQMSGGQQQRVAIARALVMNPEIILADEPTGNLDSTTSIEIMALLQKLNESSLTIVLVTHEPDIASHTKRVVELRDGLIIRDHEGQNLPAVKL